MTDKVTALPPREAREPRDPPETPADVVNLNVVTSLEVPAARVLDEARDAGLKGAVVLGFTEEGIEYFASSYPDGPTVLWLLERCKHVLLSAAEEEDA